MVKGVFSCLFLTAINTTCNYIDEFECGNGDCVNYNLTCDGVPNCKDKSDEKQSYCGKGKHFSLPTQFKSSLSVLTFICCVHNTSCSQPTGCVRRATNDAQIVAVWSIDPGVMDRMTVETILMNFSATVSPVLQLNETQPKSSVVNKRHVSLFVCVCVCALQPHCAQPINSNAGMEAASLTPASVTRRWTVRTPVMRCTAVGQRERL